MLLKNLDSLEVGIGMKEFDLNHFDVSLHDLRGPLSLFCKGLRVLLFKASKFASVQSIVYTDPYVRFSLLLLLSN